MVAKFFDDVLVMDKDERVKANRLRLLRDVRRAVGRLGDLSQIPLYRGCVGNQRPASRPAPSRNTAPAAARKSVTSRCVL